MPVLEGGCQCGAVRYEVVGAPRKLVVCHCTDCQRQSGSAFGMIIVVNEEDFQLKKGELKTYASKSDAGRAKLGAFCPECGTRIYHKPEWRKGTVSVKPGTLDDTRTKWACEHGQNHDPAVSGCGGETIPMTVRIGYCRHQFDGYLANVS